MLKTRSFAVATVLIAILTVSLLIVSQSFGETNTELYIAFGVAFVSLLAVLASLNDLTDFVSLLGKDSAKNAAPDLVEQPDSARRDIVQNITIYQDAAKQNVMLEYRVEVLEGMIEWLLENGVVVKSLSEEETKAIQQEAIVKLRKRFPDAHIAIEEGGK